MKSLPVNLDEAVQQTIQGLGAENATLRLELNAERAASAAFRTRIEELEAMVDEEAPEVAEWDDDGMKAPGD